MSYIIRIKNDQPIPDTWGSKAFAAGEARNIDESDYTKIRKDTNLMQAVLDEKALISDGSEFYLEPADGMKWLFGDVERRTLDGQAVVQSTPRGPTEVTYFTSAGDAASSHNDIGGGTELEWHFDGQGGSDKKEIYLDWNTIANKTFIYDAEIQWENAKNDNITVEIVPTVTPVVPGTNTNYDIDPGTGAIIAAAGNGSWDCPSGLSLVQIPVGSDGKRVAPGYWDSTYDPATDTFSTPTFIPDGTGEFMAFSQEFVMERFCNKKKLVWNGTSDLDSNDKSMIGHRMRIKVTIVTKDTSREWCGSATIMMYRESTVSY